MASVTTWLTNLMIEASSAAFSRLVSSSPLSSTTCSGATSSKVSMVSAPTPRRDFISRRMASLGARTGLILRPVSVLRVSNPCVAEQTAGGHFDHAVDALQGKQFLLQQNARGKERKQLAVRLDVFQRGVTQTILLGQPAENVLFRLHRLLRAGADLLVKDGGVGGGELPGGDQSDRASSVAGLSAVFVSFIFFFVRGGALDDAATEQ